MGPVEFCAVVEGIPGLMARTEIQTRASLVWLQETMSPLFQKVVKSDTSQKVMETFLTRLLLIGMGLITSVIVARILGPEGRGHYAVALAVGAIGMQLGNLGLHTSNTYYVSRDRSLLPFLVSNTLLVSFVFGGACTLLAAAAFYFWPRLAPLQGHLLTLALISIPIGLAYLLFQNLLIGIQEVRIFNIIELSSKALNVALITAVILFQWVNVESIFCSQLIALLAAFLWSLEQLRKKLSAWRPPSIELLKSHLGYGFRSFLASFGAFLVLRLDLLLVQYILGAKQAGFYSIAGTMADMVYLLPTVTGTILFPKLSAMTNDRDKWEYVKRVTILMGGVMMIICTLGAILVKPFILLLFGSPFLPAVPAFIWLMPGIVFWANSTFPLLYLQSTGMPRQVLYIWGLLISMNVTLNFLFLGKWGIVGAAAISSATYLISFLAFGAYAQKQSHG